MPSAFVSHSSPDDRYVQEFVQLVRGLGYDEVFNDSHTIEPGELFWPRIEKGIREADAFVVILSHASVKSYWVDREVQFARQQGRKVIPIRIDECQLPTSFDGRDVIELRQGRGERVKISGTQLEKHAPRMLFGRETELAALDAAWAKGTLNVYTLVAWGGAGKTSLVFHWVQTRFAAKGWPGVERYFDWSFYSQGTGESRQTSADLFIHKALDFFGDPDPTKGGPHERGERLAGLIRQHRTLLILDGIEPLQYPPNEPQAGRLKDPALESLLRELAADNPGLVVITTREHLTNVEGHATTQEQKLDKLPKEAAVALLRHLQIVGTDEELHAAWQDAGGHALTLSLLGRFIADAYEDRDIRHYREVKFEAADREHQGRSAFKVMIAYERWLQSGGPQRQRELAVLRLTGLFDRPMVKSCLQALRAEPSIPGLTDALVKLTPQQWNIAVKRLSEVELLSVSPDAIDAHPLIREYFAAQLKRDQPEAYRAAHSRLFDYWCENTPHRPDGMDGLAPLYEAVTHGCLAGRHQEACEKVYHDRILRGTGSDGFYSTKKLGAIGADLAAVAAFFDEPWTKVSPNLTEADQGWLLAVAAFNLRALGRLTEALQPMRAGLEMAVRLKDWKNAAARASNLSELEVTLGRLPDAVTDARQSITHADQSGDAFMRMVNRITAADALHQSGQRTEAGTLFAEAERMQQEMQPQFDLLYSLPGFRYCDWLLAPAEQAAWRRYFKSEISNLKSEISDCLAEVERRAQKAQVIAVQNEWLLDIALDHLTLARVGLMRAILEAGPRSGIGTQPVGSGSPIAQNSDSREASSPDDSASLHSRLWNGKRQQAAALHETLDLPHVA
ncbi:MAG: TIR domain-containing protein, partial [Planctomycetaceae bacterium]